MEYKEVSKGALDEGQRYYIVPLKRLRVNKLYTNEIYGKQHYYKAKPIPEAKKDANLLISAEYTGKGFINFVNKDKKKTREIADAMDFLTYKYYSYEPTPVHTGGKTRKRGSNPSRYTRRR